MPEFRLIVCGSRKYDDRLALRACLLAVWQKAAQSHLMVVVHGGEKNPDLSMGADKIAGEWALDMEGDGYPVRQEAWPAEWEAPCRATCEPGHREIRRSREICPAAGPYRTAAMVAAGGDYGLAALRVGTKSNGTKRCIREMLISNIAFEILVQGKGRGLPEELIRQQGQGRRDQITRRMLSG
jgi:YspA, cpYpsA-related SLOG family